MAVVRGAGAQACPIFQPVKLKLLPALDNTMVRSRVRVEPEEVRAAYDHDQVGLHAPIKVRIRGELVDTTVGRILLWEIIPQDNLLGMRHIRVAEEKTAPDQKARGRTSDRRALHSPFTGPVRS